MHECPYCGSKLIGTAKRQPRRADPVPGGKSPAVELVSCPDCEEVIDGFSLH